MATVRRTMQHGYSLIELMLVVVIIGLVSVLAGPNISSYIGNIGIRNQADAIKDGLFLARLEAIKRNLPVQIALDANGGWAVSEVISGTVIQSRTAGEGSTKATVTVTPGGATTVSYDGEGRLRANANGTNTITQLDIASTAVSGSQAVNLRILVRTLSGDAKLCDPSVVTTGDPRRCI